jgi:hypothetical protein|tara:strand:+ start:371 stop:619 length:249 start_codon:yes stop_codon:yes gene_type:complete
MGGLFSRPKMPSSAGPSQAELDAIARREKLAEEEKAKQSREIASRRRARGRRGAMGLMTAFMDRSPTEEESSTLGPMRNPRA